MTKEFLQEYFHADFKGIDSLLNEVLVPIFGNYIQGWTELTATDTLREKAAKVNIKRIKHAARLQGLGFGINVFDVTLNDNCHIHQARKGIQTLIRQYVSHFQGAFIAFHYENPEGRSWRLSYLEKQDSNANSTSAKRYTYLCGRDYPCRTLAERFAVLNQQDKTAANIETAFSVEALSDEFFAGYKAIYKEFCDYLTAHRQDTMLFGPEFATCDEKFIRDYVKKMMGRITFLHFLQRKGWLGQPRTIPGWGKGDLNFMHNLFDKASPEQKDNFLDEVLEPIFFECLNEKRDGDFFDTQVSGIRLVKIPYLNGGLFEKDEIDKPRSKFPAEKFRNLFDFFGQYNFTIDENDPFDTEVGVDPEMLGKIFENLLEDNKDKGAFYTPKEIVDYMCREALVAYLVDEAHQKSEVNKQRQDSFDDAIRAFVSDPEMNVTRLRQYDKQQLIDLQTSLCDVKICDPAIGSGAFPMGLLNLLMNCRVALNNALGIGQPRVWLKKEIIQNNIYGVDIEKGAIDIARLRFWLSIVVDLDSPEPLPNFDYKFMQGNSLLEQYAGVDLSDMFATKATSGKGSGVQLIAFDEVSASQTILLERLRHYFEMREDEDKHALRADVNAGVADLIRAKVNESPEIVKQLETLNVSANDQFFLWHTWFSDVFNRPSKQGFDIVIGNPPYGAKLSDADKKVLKVKFASARTANGLKGSLDTFSLFIELGYIMLAKQGYSSFIVPLSITASDAMSSLHQLLFDNCETISVSSYGDRPKRIFESAEQQVSIISFQKTGTPNRQLLTTHINKRYSDESLWILLDNLQFVNSIGLTSFGRIPKIGTEIEKDILRKLLKISTKLSSIYDERGKAVHYRKAGGRYYKIITTEATGSSAEGYISIKIKYRKVVAAILSSDLFYWFWLIHSDWHNLRTGELEMVPIPMNKLTDEQIVKINMAYDDYQKDLYDKCKYTKTGLRTFVARQSKPYINVLDDILCPLYGLSPKETEFIKNFEMEFRAADE